MQIVSYAPAGYHGHLVKVEVDCRTGIPGMDIVGLPASEVREARERARVAIRNSGFDFPARRILVNLSPADVPKSGNGFDLAIAVALLGASAQLPDVVKKPILVVGELHLDGSVAPVRGVLAAVAEGLDAGISSFVVPESNAPEIAPVVRCGVGAVAHLSSLPEALMALASGRGWSNAPQMRVVRRARTEARTGLLSDYVELRGVSHLKRVLEVAAAGGHHLLVVGPPGSGKSAALGLFPTIVPPLTRQEAVEVTRIHSLAREPDAPIGLASARPFRTPHHNTSTEGLLGGRLPQIPGEVALAHRGILFLDEALEFRRPVLQGLREPLERRRVSVSRARGNYWFPADFQLLMATNRCPCGMLGRRDRACLCSLAEVERYWRKLGGPLLDRIDLRLPLMPVPVSGLETTDSSATIRARVLAAESFRRDRRGQPQPNARLTAEEALEACALSSAGQELVRTCGVRFGLSTRASLSVLRVARTVADLAGELRVGEEHLLEAVSYRRHGEQRPLWEA